MRLPVALACEDQRLSARRNQRTQDAIARARIIAKRIAQRQDRQALEAIRAFEPKPRYKRHDLCIAKKALRHVKGAGIKPRLVFAHPDILKEIPNASLHYRGIALLSLKRVQEIAGSVDTWERSPESARVSDEKALKVCRLYNAVISSIIVDRDDWTLGDGYRNVLATVGITADGAIRNIIGQEAERAIKDRLVEWAEHAQLLAPSSDSGEQSWMLKDDVSMVFGSEPDIAFEKAGRLAVVVEIKGGKDPAGALERLGAVKKTFDEAPADCKNFLVAGVVTPTMQARLAEMRMERHFDIDALLYDDAAWREFVNEIFHHALRIAPER